MTADVLRTDATDVLTAWSAPTPDQAALREHYLAHLTGHADAIRRSCWPEHLTASAVVLDPARSRLAMVLHGRVNRWLPPGGHAEDGDRTLVEVAIREAEEELGLADLEPIGSGPALLDRHRAPCRPGTDDGFHLDVCFALVATGDTTLNVSHESHDVGWFDVSRLPSPTVPTMRDQLDQVLAAVSTATISPR